LCEWRLLYIFFIVPRKNPLPCTTAPSKTHRSQIRFNIFSLLTFSLQLCCHFSSPLVCDCVCVCWGYMSFMLVSVCVCERVFLRFWSSQLHVVESRAKFSIFFFCAKVCRPVFVCVCGGGGFPWKTHPSPSIMPLVICVFVCVWAQLNAFFPPHFRPPNVLRRLLQAAVIVGANMFAFPRLPFLFLFSSPLRKTQSPVFLGSPHISTFSPPFRCKRNILRHNFPFLLGCLLR